MAPSRRNSNGRSPLVNQQHQITAFFSKSTSSPSPILPKPKNPKLNPNPTSSPSLPTPSPPNPKPQHHKPLLLIGASPSPSPSSSSSLYAQDVVGRRIKVYWPLDKAWYEGNVKSFDKVTSKHLVVYDDDEEESLDLSKEKIEWVQEASSSSVKKLKRLRRGVPAVRKMVIEDDEVEQSPKGDGDDGDGGDDDDSSDEDWGKNAVVEDAEEEEDVELEDEEEDEDDAAERSKRKPSRKVEPKKRKMGGAEKLEPAKKSKSVGEVGSVKGGFKFSVLEPTNNLESE